MVQQGLEDQEDQEDQEVREVQQEQQVQVVHIDADLAGERGVPDGPGQKAARPGLFQASPVVIGDTMYVPTPYAAVAALDGPQAGARLLVWSAGFALFPTATALPELYAFRFVIAVGTAVASVMVITTMQDYPQEVSRGKWGGTNSFITSFAILLVALLLLFSYLRLLHPAA